MPLILLVDDEPSVLRVLAITLRLAGFQSAPFEHPTRALKAFSRDPQQYDLLVTDVMMPELRGTELASRMLDIRPNLPVVFVTGYSHGPDLPRSDLLARFPVINKPQQIAMLTFTVGRMLAGAKPPRDPAGA